MNKKIPQTIIEFKNFHFFYHKKTAEPALIDINLKIPADSITAIIGRSGCGKSTLLWSINRLHELNSDTKIEGDVLFKNNSIYSSKTDPIILRKKIGIVFQKPAPFKMSIFENIAFALRIHGMRDFELLEKTVISALKAVDLWEEVKDRLDRSALMLSGGQQQRLCIARCIANKPDIILLDEPTSSLDPISKEQIENLIFNLKKEYTIILVTHSLSEASKVSDYTLFLDKGKIVEFGKTKHFFTEPKKKLTAEYINREFKK